jgi:hypothetical protein
MPDLRTCASWWPQTSSVTMWTPQEHVQCVLWLPELQSLMAVHANQFVLLTCSYKFHVQECTMCYIKALPKSIQDSNDSGTKTEWPSSMHKLRCGHARKNRRAIRFPPFLCKVCFSDEATDVPCQWSCKQVQLQDLGQSKSTCMHCPNYHLKLFSNKMGRRHISATMLGTTCTERWIGRGGPIAWPPGFFLVGLCEEHCLPG